MEILVNSAQLEVDYEIEKGEKEVRWLPNGDPGHPGSPDIVTVTEVIWTDEDGQGFDVTQLILELNKMEEVETAIYEKLD